MGNSPSLQDEIFNLKFAAKRLKKQSARCKKAEKAELNKVKKSIEQGHRDIARVHAENAIRQKNEALNLLRLSSRMEAIVQRLQSAEAAKQINKSMISVSKVMQKAVEAMNVEKISKSMDQFEQNFEELDIQSSVMEAAVQHSTGQTMPVDQVDSLIQQVADEHRIAFDAEVDGIKVPANKSKMKEEEDDLEKRFNELKDAE
eukprot:TRINITY_DN115114_c0_g1_i1.p2 TRINITY_DN115114_c0_g1~~TRINITY_DN115114_c0_g1_i1.p2  ORF type:complete len:202 (+),score=115.91 TRINITY_DN115114_c0_g1_i1:62-667(+)